MKKNIIKQKKPKGFAEKEVKKEMKKFRESRKNLRPNYNIREE